MDKTSVLSRYMPAEAAPLIAKWIDHFRCEFKISKGRNTKFGDYRPPMGTAHHRISVNFNLNPYAFLVTTVHEFAHLVTWNSYKGRVKPHGTEWKENFKKLMQPFFDRGVFPAELQLVLRTYLQNPSASSCTDVNLFRALKKYDTNAGSLVESLPFQSKFMLKDGRTFSKGPQLRKRYSCTELATGRIYLFNPLAEVYPLRENTH